MVWIRYVIDVLIKRWRWSLVVDNVSRSMRYLASIGECLQHESDVLAWNTVDIGRRHRDGLLLCSLEEVALITLRCHASRWVVVVVVVGGGS